ncbi:hypothetical protein J3A65_000402 [Rhizobium sp. PvP014]|nr:hypothetical protein [Rhizobium sp. PvP014]MBP2531009.1 hypothetical protein [Rhizobium sp. PvP099]
MPVYFWETRRRAPSGIIQFHDVEVALLQHRVENSPVQAARWPSAMFSAPIFPEVSPCEAVASRMELKGEMTKR